MTYEIKYRNEEEMKDSGIEWLGTIPKEWSIIANKYIAKINTGGKDTQDSIENGKYPFFVRSEKIERINSYSFDGEAILTPGDGDIGGIFHYINGKFDFHQRVYKYSNFKNYNGKYLYYYLKIFLKGKVMGLSAKSTVDSIRLPMLLNLECLLTEEIQQLKIANFLDHKTSEFDSIISKKELLIEKLDEAKKSLISEIVTGKVKIVDGKLVEREPEEMKDSGVQRLGMIPKDWEVMKLKYLFNFKNGVNADADQYGCGIKFINVKEIIDKDILMYEDIPNSVKISRHQLVENIVVKGDVLLNRTSETRDEIGIATLYNDDKIVIFGGFVIRGRAKGNYLEDLFKQYLLSTFEVRKQIILYSSGSIRKNIAQSKLNEVYVSYPNKKEQLAIIGHLNNKLLKIDSIITKTKLQTEKLKQAKQSLISEAVTGKIDLRDWEIQEI